MTALRALALVEEAKRRGQLDDAALLRIQREAREGRTLDSLVREIRGGLAELAAGAGVPFVDVAAVEPAPALLQRVPEALIRRKRVLPVRKEGEVAIVATVNPEDGQALDALERALGMKVRLALADPRALDAAIERALARLARPVREDDAVSLLDHLLREAFERRASDVHVEPQANDLRVRFRVDGHLQVRKPSLRLDLVQPLLSRIKVLSGLDIAEKREPQDGGFAWAPSPEARPIDLRVATAPCRHGERATIRLLGVETEALTLDTLGLSSEKLTAFRAAINRPHGMVLLCGPTGSGKTTTLYAVLRELNKPDVNVITVEDPIEYSIPGINQVQVDGVGKVNFANVLRALLRHDPDVLMVGEIRDAETADVAIKSAMTGHLVLSTLHTNTAVGAVTRLVDLGGQPFLVASTLACVVAQRLVRRLCTQCKRKEGDRWVAVGCDACYGTGFRGRCGIFEVVVFDRELEALIARGCTEGELAAEVAKRGTRSLRTEALARVADGTTTEDEVLSATVES